MNKRNTRQDIILPSGAAVCVQKCKGGYFRVSYRGDSWERETRPEAMQLVKMFKDLERQEARKL